MNRKQQIKEINLVLNYSDKVYGSCTHSYMGCMADARLHTILGCTRNIQLVPEQGFKELLETATDEQITEGHEYVTHWIPIAKAYMSPRSRVSRIIRELA